MLSKIFRKPQNIQSIYLYLILGNTLATSFIWGWATSSILLGLGYTFFSGATEAWLVDALKATNFKGHLEGVFAKGQIVGGAAIAPIRQAYLNGLIPTQQRATVLSFDSLLGSTGGIVIQPFLGKVTDVGGYPASYAISSVFQFATIPFIYLAHRTKSSSDIVDKKT